MTKKNAKSVAFEDIQQDITAAIKEEVPAELPIKVEKEKLFSICVQLPKDAALEGLEALDFRRRMGLKDKVEVRTNNYHEPGIRTWCKVDEGFARLYFPRNKTTVTRQVTFDQLSKGDLVDIYEGYLGGGLYKVYWNNDLSEERITELWLAGTPVE